MVLYDIMKRMDKNQYSRCCEAMTEKGVTDPESQSGIDFCTQECPYDFCVVFESDAVNINKAKGRRKIAMILRSHKMELDDIALVLGININTVRRYFKKK